LILHNVIYKPAKDIRYVRTPAHVHTSFIYHYVDTIMS